MYLAEWMMWMSNLKPDEWFMKNVADNGQMAFSWTPTFEEDVAQERAVQKAKRFDRAVSRGPVYAANDVFLEMRCGGMEDKRGLITLASGVFVGMMTYGWALSSGPILFGMLAGSTKALGNPIDAGQVFDLLLDVILFGVPLWLYFKHAFRLSRRECPDFCVQAYDGFQGDRPWHAIRSPRSGLASRR